MTDDINLDTNKTEVFAGSNLAALADTTPSDNMSVTTQSAVSVGEDRYAVEAFGTNIAAPSTTELMQMERKAMHAVFHHLKTDPMSLGRLSPGDQLFIRSRAGARGKGFNRADHARAQRIFAGIRPSLIKNKAIQEALKRLQLISTLKQNPHRRSDRHLLKMLAAKAKAAPTTTRSTLYISGTQSTRFLKDKTAEARRRRVRLNRPTLSGQPDLTTIDYTSRRRRSQNENRPEPSI